MSEYNRALQAKAYSVASLPQRNGVGAASFDPAGHHRYRSPIILDAPAYAVLIG